MFTYGNTEWAIQLSLTMLGWSRNIRSIKKELVIQSLLCLQIILFKSRTHVKFYIAITTYFFAIKGDGKRIFRI